MLKTLLILLSPLFALSVVAQSKIPLYRYNRDDTKTHYFTTNKNELGEGKNGYVLEGMCCFISAKKSRNTVPFYRYANGKDYVYSSSFGKDKIELKKTYRLQKKLGYIYTQKTKGTVPLYKYYSYSLKRHFYTVSFSEIGKHDDYYDLEGIAGYVFYPR